MFLKKYKNFVFLSLLIILVCISYFYHFRIDLTSDKRYSISVQTKNLISKIDKPIQVIVYLDGDLNPGFQRLKKSTVELLEELSFFSGERFQIQFINPSLAESNEPT